MSLQVKKVAFIQQRKRYKQAYIIVKRWRLHALKMTRLNDFLHMQNVNRVITAFVALKENYEKESLEINMKGQYFRMIKL